MSSKKRKPDEYEDIYSHSQKPKKKKSKRKSKKPTHEVAIGLVCAFVVLLLVATGSVALYVRSKMKMINYDDGVGGNPDATFSYLEEEENLHFNNIADPNGSETVKELMKTWATNGGDHLYSKNVINVLLVGEDSEDGTSRSDSTILLTVNKKTRKIILTSFLRDSYTYMNIEGQDRYDKTNHSYSWGGPAKLMEVLSNNYKITIDHFVTINYESFIKAVDSLGGVNVMVTDAEARYMNNTTKLKGFESGSSVNLDGRHALVFARIRKLDGEEQRTERQRRLITAVINSVKNSSVADIDNALDTFLPYITTNYRENEIINLATKAVTEGWLKYDIVSQVAPSEATKMGFKGYRTYTGNLDVWIVDYVKAAQEVQLSLYGQTNITIDENDHVSAIDLALGNYSYDGGEDYDDGEYDYSEEETTETNWYDYTFPGEIPTLNINGLVPDISGRYPNLRPNYGIEDFTLFAPDKEEETTPDTEYDEESGEGYGEGVTEEYEE